MHVLAAANAHAIVVSALLPMSGHGELHDGIDMETRHHRLIGLVPLGAGSETGAYGRPKRNRATAA
jgi:hypothetical protein